MQDAVQKPPNSFVFAAMNAGGRAGTDIAKQALWSSVVGKMPLTKIIFISECDFLSIEEVSERRVGDFHVLRHWPGAGSRAMCWLVDASFRPFVRSWWSGRAGGLRVAAGAKCSASDVGLVGWHGAHEEEALAAVTNLQAVLRHFRELKNIYMLGDANIDHVDEGGWCQSDAPFERARPRPAAEARWETRAGRTKA